MVSLLFLAIPVWFWMHGASRKRTPQGEPTIPRFQVDLNRATAQELELLPGFGPKRVRDVEAYRRENGPFDSLKELDNVPGIGEARMEQIGQSLIVHPPERPKE